MIAAPRLGVLMPDSIASRIGAEFPPHVRAAVWDAADARRRLALCTHPRYEEARYLAYTDLARANRVLAAHNPGLVHAWTDPNHR